MAGFLNTAKELYTTYMAPVPKVSKFYETGVLTPEEFVRAGDNLVFKCQTWQWSGGDPSKRKSYLPADKQFLMTKRVPCEKRASEMNLTLSEEVVTDASGDWVVASDDSKTDGNQVGDLEDDLDFGGKAATSSSSSASSSFSSSSSSTSASSDEKAISHGIQGMRIIEDHVAKPEVIAADEAPPDLEDFDDVDNLAPDPTTVPSTYLTAQEPEDDIKRIRTYDVSIVYDLYQQVPRVYFIGYDENNLPLTREQTLEDISCEHANQTVTFDPHPHIQSTANYASIHPCQHASVMKRLIELMEYDDSKGSSSTSPSSSAASATSSSSAASTTREPRVKVENYFFLFLKFVQTAVPTIVYDFGQAFS